MRRVFLHINVSLDGFIEDEAGEIDWHFSDGEFHEYLLELLGSIDGMIFGRVSHGLLATYWPGAESDPPEPWQAEAARRMNWLPKYVLSRGGDIADWENSRVLEGDPGAAVRRLKREAGGDIALFAGASAARALMDLDVVDEYRIVLNPIVLGGGTPLWGSGRSRKELRLRDVRRFESGALVLSYEPASGSDLRAQPS